MSIVYLVHCVDTEGPLDEHAYAHARQGRRYRPATLDREALERDFWGEVGRQRARTLGSWEMIGEMLRRCTSGDYRRRMTDSDGGGWIYNWFCMEHVGFTDNPRGRDMGMHRIFDFYRALVEEQESAGDALHWHFHSMSTYGQANICATSYLNSPQLREIVGRRLLDRGWFPRANRAGFHDERPDSHWFLEQWVPFDLSNKAGSELDPARNPDVADNRFGDWRGAPTDWSTYHPDHDYHQRPGNCRRKIARCLTLLNRFGNLSEAELEAGFRRAAEGRPTLVAFCSHDWRDLGPEVDYVRHLLERVAARFPAVRFRFTEAVEAFNAVHPPAAGPALELDCRLERDAGGCRRLTVRTLAGKVFGPQPFLAIRTRSQRIINDNLSYGADFRVWHYLFDEQSVLPDDVRTIGIAANDEAGNQAIHVIKVDQLAGEGDVVIPELSHGGSGSSRRRADDAAA